MCRNQIMAHLNAAAIKHRPAFAVCAAIIPKQPNAWSAASSRVCGRPNAGRYYLGARYLREKQRQGRPEKCGQGVHITDRTCERIAEEENVNEKTVRRAGDFARMVD